MTDQWQCLRTVLLAESPIHIGWHSLGLIHRTRYYIPARSLWGALVAGLAPRLGGGDSALNMYQKCAENLESCLRFTYFFAMTKGPGGEDIHRPRYEYVDKDHLNIEPSQENKGDKKCGLSMGNLRSEDFEHEFVYSQTSAALNVRTLSAEEGALHESEFLTPHIRAPRGGSPKALRFLGYLFLHHSLSCEFVKNTLRSCAVGADRRYGWGCLQLEEAEVYHGKLFNEFRIRDWTRSGPVIEPVIFDHFQLPAHLIYEESQEGLLEGDLEVLSGRNWDPQSGSGRGIETVKVCWAPGSRRIPGQSGRWQFQIDAKGLWKAEKQTSDPPGDRRETGGL